MKIQHITARQILDSRGNPTVEADVVLANGVLGRAAVPSGASTGTHEAVELRDEDEKQFHGKSVHTAITHVNTTIAKALIGQEVDNQSSLDRKMIQLDGTPNKANLGANAMLAVSMAACKAAAKNHDLPVYQYIGNISGVKKFSIPRPMVLLVEGGKHGNWATDLQEFMILPRENAFESFADTIRAASEIFMTLEKILHGKGFATGVGFEGAFCPQELQSNEEGFELVISAVEKAGYKMGEQFDLAIDGASSEFYKNGMYTLISEGGKEYTPHEWTHKVVTWADKYPIASFEDMHDQELWEEWRYLTLKIGKSYQIVGDDLVTTNVTRIQKAIEEKAINSVLIKLNQIGTVTETIEAVKLTHKAGFKSVVSHRGSESNDDFAADFAVGTGSEECKFGGPDRGERVAKYNQLLRIEQTLGKNL